MYCGQDLDAPAQKRRRTDYGAQLGHHSGRHCESENVFLVLGPGLGVDRRPWVGP